MVTIVGLEKRKAADGCKYIRDTCNAYWLSDALLSRTEPNTGI
jgi:hypothetical protein